MYLPEGFKDNLAPLPGRSPYYIVVPRYVRTSAGIRALHVLCHWLNKTGQSAFLCIYPDWSGLKVNPELLTPVLDQSIIDHHFAQGLTPIVVYPEGIRGDPFNAPVRVRWLGNYLGLLGGGHKYDPGEIHFGFSARLAAAVNSPSNVLNIPVIDTTIYKPTPIAPRAGTCYYAAKYKEVHNQQVFGLPEGCFEITRDRPDMLSPPEIADLFRRSELFYCFEDTALANEAALCGCPVVLMKNKYFEWPLAIDEVGWDGYAWGDDPVEIERAKRTVNAAYDNYARNIPKFFSQLHHFILTTQNRAKATPYLSAINVYKYDYQSVLKQIERKILSPRGRGARLEAKPDITLWQEGDGGAGERGVEFVSGWGASGHDASKSYGGESILILQPPERTEGFRLRLSGSMHGQDVDVSVFVDCEFATRFSLTEGEDVSIHVPVTWPGKPLLVSFESDFGSSPADRPRAAFRLNEVAAIVFESQEQGVIENLASIDLLDREHAAISSEKCAIVRNKDLRVHATEHDPRLSVSLNKRRITKDRLIVLWCIYHASQDDELQVFLPEDENGEIIEGCSSRAKIKKGLNALTLALPRVSSVNFLRLDPLHHPGEISFLKLELVFLRFSQALQFEALPSPQNAGSGLGGFQNVSLLSAHLSKEFLGCLIYPLETGVRVVLKEPENEIRFDIPVAARSPQALLFIEYEAKVERNAEIVFKYSTGAETRNSLFMGPKLGAITLPLPEPEGLERIAISFPTEMRAVALFRVDLIIAKACLGVDPRDPDAPVEGGEIGRDSMVCQLRERLARTEKRAEALERLLETAERKAASYLRDSLRFAGAVDASQKREATRKLSVADQLTAMFHLPLARSAKTIAPHFDVEWYLQQYSQVKSSPIIHYLKFGAKENFDPSPYFSTAWYLQNNPDVKASGVNPLVHFVEHGIREGRDPHPCITFEDYERMFRERADVPFCG